MKIFISAYFILSTFGNVCGRLISPGNSNIDCKKERTVQICDSYTPYRTFDGTCNNLYDKTLGASNTRVQRFLPAKYADRHNLGTPIGWPTVANQRKIPTPQEVSNGVFTVLQHDLHNRARVSNFHMAFGQFLDHDLSLSNNPGGCISPKCENGLQKEFKYPCCPLLESQKTNATCHQFTRSFAVCKRGRREQINVLTSYIDASNVYGSSKDEADRVRSKVDGFLKVGKHHLLPSNPLSNNACKNRTGGCYLAGDGRVNEHIGLVGLHTIFLRLHNIIAARLRDLNEHWNDENIFQETRKIIIGIMQNIVYNEYVPTLVDIERYKGYNITVDPRIANVFSTVAFRFGHSQVKNNWSRLDSGFNYLLPNLPLRQTYFNNTEIANNGIEPVFFGLLGNYSEAVDTEFPSGIAEKLFIPPINNGFQNLIAINIQRSRDHGIRGYNDWRHFCGLKRKSTFDEYKKEISNKNLRDKLQFVYNSTDNHIDLFAAGLAETPTNGKLIGPTFQCIIGLQFKKLRDGDRFWFERSKVFSRYQRYEIRKVTMAKVLCLTLKGIVSLQKDVFKVFNATSNRRVSCEGIPDLNVRVWRERKPTVSINNISYSTLDS